MSHFAAVWGNGSTGVEAGVLGTYLFRAGALTRVHDFLTSNDNPAVGAWVRPADGWIECSACRGKGCDDCDGFGVVRE